MTGKEYPLFYFSAVLAISGTIGYHTLMKRIPEGVNPLVSILGIYIAIVILTAFFLPFFIGSDILRTSIRQLNGLQAGIALCILLMELGFLLMYRSGWSLSTGNILTGTAVNVILAFIGIIFLKENISTINAAGLILCLFGVVLTGFQNSETAQKLDAVATQTSTQGNTSSAPTNQATE